MIARGNARVAPVESVSRELLQLERLSSRRKQAPCRLPIELVERILDFTHTPEAPAPYLRLICKRLERYASHLMYRSVIISRNPGGLSDSQLLALFQTFAWSLPAALERKSCVRTLCLTVKPYQARDPILLGYCVSIMCLLRSQVRTLTLSGFVKFHSLIRPWRMRAVQVLTLHSTCPSADGDAILRCLTSKVFTAQDVTLSFPYNLLARSFVSADAEPRPLQRLSINGFDDLDRGNGSNFWLSLLEIVRPECLETHFANINVGTTYTGF